MPRLNAPKPPRGRMVNFRVTEAELAELHAAAAKNRLTTSEYCRDVILSGLTHNSHAGRLKRIEAAAVETLAVVRGLAAGGRSISGGAAE